MSEELKFDFQDKSKVAELEAMTDLEDEMNLEEDINSSEILAVDKDAPVTNCKNGDKIVHDYASPRWTAEYPDCSMPMTFDTYSNCAYGCIYCFSQFQRGLGLAKEKYLRKEVHAVNVEKIKRMFLDPDSTQFGEYIKARKVMQWGGLSDQFDEFEREYGVTLELLRFFREIDYPLCFSTKATCWLDDPRYTELFKDNKKWNCKFSIITNNAEHARIIEAGVDTPQKRLEAIGKYADLNAGGATLRLRPFIIGVSNLGYIDLIKDAAKMGATAVSTEFFCVETRNLAAIKKFEHISKIAGFDIVKFYRRYSIGSGYLRLNRKVKAPFVKNMKEACEETGMRFYVSDMDFKDACHNGCCCGLSEDWNYSRGQLTHAICVAKEKGVVHYSDIAEDVKTIFSGFPYTNGEGLNTNSTKNRANYLGMSMEEHVRYMWNSPKKGNSPYRIFRGSLVPMTNEEGEFVYDENGDMVYKYVDRGNFFGGKK